MPGWNDLRQLVRQEFHQSREEGRDLAALDALQAEYDRAGDDDAALRDIWRRVLAVPISADFPFVEPSDLESIRAARPALTTARRRFDIPADRAWLFDRIHGAWLGRCAGCSLGKPVESYMDAKDGISSRECIKRYHTAVSPDEWPIRDYIPASSPAVATIGPLSWNQSTRGKLAFAEMDDDLCYTVVAQIVLARHGKAFTTRDVAATWMSVLPYRHTCGGCTMAFRNLVHAGEFHLGKKRDIDWAWVSTNDNPFREWIGAQIRADAWAYAAPGRPEFAAEMAWRDARMSHVKNGVYGEMFVAAMIAAAFALDEPKAIIESGLAEIPARSRLAEAVRWTVSLCERHGCDPARLDAVMDEIEPRMGHYSPVHTINNAAIVVAALLLGGGDFERTITLSVMAGWDTDCNGATAGSICGAMLGAAKLPPRWIAPLNDTLRAGLAGYDPISLTECANRSVAQAMKE